MTHKLTAIGISLGVIALLTLTFITYFPFHTDTAKGSIIEGHAYNATTTAASAVYGSFTGDKLLQTGPGSLGSMVVTGANTGTLLILNATTTNINLRTGNTPTSSIVLASVPASMAAGTYTFDVVYTTGLYFDLLEGNMPTTTITWR